MAVRVQKAIVVDGSKVDKNQTSMQLALFDTTGAVLTPVKKQAAQADSTATDVAGLKADLNALLAKLRLGGVLS